MTLCAFSLCNLFDIYTWCMRFIPVYSAVALSAVSGQVLWKKVMAEAVMYIQCGLQYSTVPSPVCLLICKSYIMAVNGTTGWTQCCPSCAEVNKIHFQAFKDISFPSTGKKLWSSSIKSIESQAVLLPDLQGDSHPDLLVATLPADDVCQPPLFLHMLYWCMLEFAKHYFFCSVHVSTIHSF